MWPRTVLIAFMEREGVCKHWFMPAYCQGHKYQNCKYKHARPTMTPNDAPAVAMAQLGCCNMLSISRFWIEKARRKRQKKCAILIAKSYGPGLKEQLRKTWRGRKTVGLQAVMCRRFCLGLKWSKIVTNMSTSYVSSALKKGPKKVPDLSIPINRPIDRLSI